MKKILFFLIYMAFYAVFFTGVGMVMAKLDWWPSVYVEDFLNQLEEVQGNLQFNFKEDVHDVSPEEKEKRMYSKFSSETGLLASHEGRGVGDEYIIFSHGSKVSLMTKNAVEVHQWVHDKRAGFIQGLYLFDNGDILYNKGTRLFMRNKDSKLLWDRGRNSSHDVDFYNNEIYVIEHRWKKIDKNPFPCFGVVLEHASGKYFDDVVTVLDRDGKEVDEISILDAICKSDFQGLFSATGYFADIELSVARKSAVLNKLEKAEAANALDPMHANSVYIINKEDGASLGFANEGDLLVSVRNINSVVLIDRKTRLVKWARTGEFIRQHDARIVENRYLGVFDNMGSFSRGMSSRVVLIDVVGDEPVREYSPYPEFDFPLPKTGMFHYGNEGKVLTSDGVRLFEIDAGNKVGWAYLSTYNKSLPVDGNILFAEYVGCKKLAFMNVSCQ